MSTSASSCNSTGNAKIAGLVNDLHLTGLQYNLCAAMFFVSASPLCDVGLQCSVECRSRIAYSKSLRTFSPAHFAFPSLS